MEWRNSLLKIKKVDRYKLMKTLNNFFIASLIILSCEVITSNDIQLPSIDTQVQSDANETLVLNNQKKDDAEFKRKERENFESRDAQGNIPTIESIALQQPGADVVESVVFNFEDVDLKKVADETK